MAVDMVARFLANGKSGGGNDGYSKSEIDAKLNAKADQSALSALQTTVEGEVSGLETKLNTKADQSALSALQTTIEQVKNWATAENTKLETRLSVLEKGLKKKIFEEVTTDTTGGIYFNSDITRSIVLGAYTSSRYNNHSITLEPWYNSDGAIYLHATQSDTHADIISEAIQNVIVYYLDIQNFDISEETVRKETSSEDQDDVHEDAPMDFIAD